MSLKTKQAYEWDKVLIAFVGENCSFEVNENLEDLKSQYKEFKESLDEISMMIMYSQDNDWEEETAQWRKMMMRTKMQMREIKNKIKMIEANINQKEIIYS